MLFNTWCVEYWNISNFYSKIHNCRSKHYKTTIFSHTEKDDDLPTFIRISKVAYTMEVHVAWDLKHEKNKFSKVRQLKEIYAIASYHE
jgi:hypothetical protein